MKLCTRAAKNIATPVAREGQMIVMTDGAGKEWCPFNTEEKSRERARHSPKNISFPVKMTLK